MRHRREITILLAESIRTLVLTEPGHCVCHALFALVRYFKSIFFAEVDVRSLLRVLAIGCAIGSATAQQGSALPDFSHQCNSFCIQTADTCRLINDINRGNADQACRDGWGAASQTNCTQIYADQQQRLACRQCFISNEQQRAVRNIECNWRYNLCQIQCEGSCNVSGPFIDLWP